MLLGNICQSTKLKRQYRSMGINNLIITFIHIRCIGAHLQTMNIRKKILFNPSHLKSGKPDTRDNTTAHTKNSAIHQRDSQIRSDSTQGPFNYRNQRKVLRNLTREKISKKRRQIFPTNSALSNENFYPLKTVNKKKLDKLQSGRQKQLQQKTITKMTEDPSQMARTNDSLARKFYNFPNSLHLNSHKLMASSKRTDSIAVTESGVKDQTSEVSDNYANMTLLEIERRKSKLNSQNMVSFYNSQKSLNINSIMQEKRAKNEELQKLKKKVDISARRQGKTSQQPINSSNDHEVAPEQFSSSVSSKMSESIVEEIERGSRVVKEERSRLFEAKGADNHSVTEWSNTLQSGFTSSRGQGSAKKSKCQQNEANQSSLYESEDISSRGSRIVDKKQEKYEELGNYEKNADEKNAAEYQSSLCESYQIETPTIKKK